MPEEIRKSIEDLVGAIRYAKNAREGLLIAFDEQDWPRSVAVSEGGYEEYEKAVERAADSLLNTVEIPIHRKNGTYNANIKIGEQRYRVIAASSKEDIYKKLKRGIILHYRFKVSTDI